MKKFLFICALTAMTVSAARAQFVWYDGRSPVTYQVVGKTDPVVNMALRMFCDDLEQVTGQRPVKSEKQDAKATVVIKQGRGQDDGFRLSVSAEGQIVVEGHNGRGAAYGLLELSRQAGVSPWVWWGDVVPEHKDRLVFTEADARDCVPSVDYRGIFINDEDWSIRRWTLPASVSPEGEQGMLGPNKYRRIFELLLRLRGNAIWPAMHEGTPGFFTVKGNKEMADSFGILIGSSHCEPLLRNNVAEWDVKQRGPYNYITNRRAVQDYWAERLKEVKGSEELFTIGMRGIHDGSMEGVKTPEEKLNGLQQVIDDQRVLLRKYYLKSTKLGGLEQVPQVFIPYKEVLEIMESGLRVPDDVMLMWCDDNYGYLTRLPDVEQQKRKGGGGVYYHLSYWGRPHDHLWLTTTQPGLIYSEMKAAYDHNCRRLWIANEHDPKVAAYDLELFMDMAWDIDRLSTDRLSTDRLSPDPSLRGRGVITLEEHLGRWLCTQFGEEVGTQLLPVMQEYYHQNAIRKPEFMGWTQVELDKKKYPGGKSLVGQVGFTRQEAADRLETFGRMKAVVDKCRLLVRPELSDAYFAHVVYPVYASAAMTRKVVSDSVESHRAYEEIRQLTAQYNALGHGKWQGLMDAAPRQLPVFGDVRGQLAEGSVFHGVACNAADYVEAGSGVRTIPMLGHSMKAVSLPKGERLVYRFEVTEPTDATLYTAMIPTQPSDRGDLRYSVQIDDREPVVLSLKTPYRSESWKQSVLRGQALQSTPVTLAEGRHTLTIQALDDHIIADQWMLDFDKNHQFYVIPLN